MKKTISIIILTTLILIPLTACAQTPTAAQPQGDTSRELDHADFMGHTIGIMTGTILDVVVEEEFLGTVAFYSDISSGLEDVRRNRIAGVMADLSIGIVITSKPENQDLQVIPVPGEWFSGPMGAISLNQDIIDRFNVFLKGIEEDGTLEDIHNYWLFDNPGSDPAKRHIELIGENGVLRVGTSGVGVPFTYIGANGEVKGLSIEIIERFAAHEGMDIEFHVMDFAAMIPSVMSGKIDISIDSMTITEERKKSVIFTDPFFYDYAGIIALKSIEDSEDIIHERVDFITWLRIGVERNLITDNRWMLIVDGLGVTMTIAFFAQIFGTIFGAFICWLLTNKNRFIRGFGNFYCGLIHGTPIVVLLMVTYYIIFGTSTISNVIMAIVAFTMLTGSGVARSLQSAISTVDPVEIEAARSLGFSAFKAFMTVTLPQAVKRALPSYTNGFVELVKATAIVGYIAIQDLTRAGDIIRSRTYDAFFPLLTVAVIYLVVTTICVQVFKLIVKRFGT